MDKLYMLLGILDKRYMDLFLTSWFYSLRDMYTIDHLITCYHGTSLPIGYLLLYDAIVYSINRLTQLPSRYSPAAPWGLPIVIGKQLWTRGAQQLDLWSVHTFFPLASRIMELSQYLERVPVECASWKLLTLIDRAEYWVPIVDQGDWRVITLKVWLLV